MRLAVFASLLTAGAMWLALGGAPVQSQQDGAKKTCASCAKSCPHCAAKGHGAHTHGHPHQFEYKCVHQSERTSKKAADAMSAQFSGLGELGWRLAKADNGFWCFARHKGNR